MEIALIPMSAPFNDEQRAWLNGFLAGWLGIGEPGDARALKLATAAAPAVLASPKPEPEPWHDPALAIGDRMKLAEEKELSHKLMAAMAQLDCGSCGYVCRSYADAIASGEEPRLSLCTPGGSETSKALNRLVKAAATPAVNGHVPAKATANGWSRENPFTARIVRSVNLNRPGSEKETRHVEIELGSDGPEYAVGDSLGVYPENCDSLVDEIIAVLGARGDEPATLPNSSDSTLRDVLIAHYCLSEVTDELLTRLAEAATSRDEAALLREYLEDDAPIAGLDVLDLLRRFPSARLAPKELLPVLSELKPRLYSISSSPKRHHGHVHLTVRRVTYQHMGRERKGVASTMLADRVAPGSPLRVFVQKSHGFSLPEDPATPIIMIGPGTGVAPFRAFLHERDAVGAEGRNWLFFGDQRGGHDYLYEEELTHFRQCGVLTRLDTAFSRDSDRKVYVQDRLRERGEVLFHWIKDGAHLYVCGDAKRMAADVDRALHQVVQEHGGLSEEASAAYIAHLSSTGRYRRDVY